MKLVKTILAFGLVASLLGCEMLQDGCVGAKKLVTGETYRETKEALRKSSEYFDEAAKAAGRIGR